MSATDQECAPGEAPSSSRPDAARALEAERDFLLRSIADLDAEREAGEIGDAQYRRLHDSYTVRAATVLRALQALAEREVVAVEPERARRGPSWLFVAGFAVLVAVGAVLLTQAVGQRQPGGTITGNAQANGTRTTGGSGAMGQDLASAEAAAKESPDDPEIQKRYARALMGTGRLLDALKVFDRVTRLDPSDADARAYGGWIVFLGNLPDEALRRVDAAIAVDPGYPDARFFRGMILLRGKNDRAGALVELKEFVRLSSPGPERDQVEALIASLENPETSPSAPGSTAPGGGASVNGSAP